MPSLSAFRSDSCESRINLEGIKVCKTYRPDQIVDGKSRGVVSEVSLGANSRSSGKRRGLARFKFMSWSDVD